MIKNHIKIILAFLLSFIAVIVIPSPASCSTVFGPKKYVRTTGGPNTYTDTFRSAEGAGSLMIRNGTDAGENRVTSATIYLNGIKIFKPDHFKKSVHFMEESIQLNHGNNTLHVELTSKPGSYIAVEVIRDVSIDINVTSPLDGSSSMGPYIMVTGTINNSNGTETGVAVNGIPAALSNNQFALNHVPLTNGQNTITVIATDMGGSSATKTITVNATLPTSYIELNASSESGTPPLEVTLRINGSFGLNDTIITSSGPGTAEQLAGTDPDEYRYRLTAEGIYFFTAQTIGPDNNAYQDTVAIAVLSLAQIDALLKAKWETMKSALISGDTETALNFLVPGNREKYREIFAALGPAKTQAVFSSINSINLSRVYGNVASCGALRQEAGGTYSYPLIFVRDGNGIWKIFEF